MVVRSRRLGVFGARTAVINQINLAGLPIAAAKDARVRLQRAVARGTTRLAGVMGRGLLERQLLISNSPTPDHPGDRQAQHSWNSQDHTTPTDQTKAKLKRLSFWYTPVSNASTQFEPTECGESRTSSVQQPRPSRSVNGALAVKVRRTRVSNFSDPRGCEPNTTSLPVPLPLGGQARVPTVPAVQSSHLDNQRRYLVVLPSHGLFRCLARSYQRSRERLRSGTSSRRALRASSG